MYLTLVQVRLHRLALRPLELVVVPAGGGAVQLQHTAAELVRRGRALVLLRQGHIGALGEKLDGLGKAEALDVHDEIDDVAALFAAEAVVDLLVRRDGEGGRFFIVEGAQAEEVAAVAGEGDVAGDHVHDVAAGGELL